MHMIDPRLAGHRRGDRRDHRGPGCVGMKQVKVVHPNQTPHADRRPKIDAMLHWKLESLSPAAIVFVQHLGKAARFDAGKIGGDPKFWEATPEVRLDSFGPGKVLAIDDMQDLEVDRWRRSERAKAVGVTGCPAESGLERTSGKLPVVESIPADWGDGSISETGMGFGIDGVKRGRGYLLHRPGGL